MKETLIINNNMKHLFMGSFYISNMKVYLWNGDLVLKRNTVFIILSRLTDVYKCNISIFI